MTADMNLQNRCWRQVLPKVNTVEDFARHGRAEISRAGLTMDQSGVAMGVGVVTIGRLATPLETLSRV